MGFCITLLWLINCPFEETGVLNILEIHFNGYFVLSFLAYSAPIGGIAPPQLLQFMGFKLS